MERYETMEGLSRAEAFARAASPSARFPAFHALYFLDTFVSKNMISSFCGYRKSAINKPCYILLLIIASIRNFSKREMYFILEKQIIRKKTSFLQYVKR